MLLDVSSCILPETLSVHGVSTVRAVLRWTHPYLQEPLATSDNQLLGFLGFLFIRVDLIQASTT